MEDRWRLFERTLAEYLGTMRWGEEPDALRLAVEPTWSDTGHLLPYALIEATGKQTLQVTMPKEPVLAEGDIPEDNPDLHVELGLSDGPSSTLITQGRPDEADDLARRTVAALRRAFGLRHPGFLSWTATGPNAVRAARLGIARPDHLRRRHVWARSFGMDLGAAEGLLEEVVAFLARNGSTFHRDGDALVLDYFQTAPIRITSPTSRPGFLILSMEILPWRDGRHSRRSQLERLQGEEACCTWTLAGDRIVQRMAVPAVPFDSLHFRLALSRFRAEAVGAEKVLVSAALSDPARPPSRAAQLRLLSPEGTSLAIIPVTYPNQRGDARRTGYHLVDVELVDEFRVVRNLDRWFSADSLTEFSHALLAIGFDEHPEQSAPDFDDDRSGIHLHCINSDEQMVDVHVRCTHPTESGIGEVDSIDLHLTRATLIVVAQQIIAWTTAHDPPPNQDGWVPDGW